MKIINVVQGSPEWKALRARGRPASEAPAVMGASAKVKRSDLLHMKATSTEQQFSRWVEEVLFANGHAVEERARPIAAKIIGDDLYRVFASDDEGYLMASFDGITMAEDCGAEIKQWNESKAAHVREHSAPPPEDLWQVVQQLAVSGAPRWLYMVSNGTEAGSVHCWVERDEALIEQLRAGWRQFDADLAAYVPPEPEVAVEGRTLDALPALRIEISGGVMASNLDVFQERAIEVFRSIKTDLQTDQDFADAEKAVKWCGDIEERLAAAKQHALSQTASIDELFRAIDSISAEARAKRLELDKLVKTRKESIRTDIVLGGKSALRDHIDQINKTLGKIRLPEIAADFAGVIRGKKTLSSLRNAVDTELARAKIEADRIANGIRVNLDALRELAAGYETLFMDAQTLVTTKAEDDLRNLISFRINEHKQKEQARIDAERARIRAEEEAKAKRQAEAAAERERARVREEERQRAEREAAERKATELPPALDAPPVNVVSVNTPAIVSAVTEPDESVVAVVSAAAAPAPKARLIKLGDINARIAPLSINAEGLASLGFHSVGTERAAKLYSANEFPAMVDAIVDKLLLARNQRAAA